MNLQISIPYEPCVYKCPMCVARGHKHNYTFENVYQEKPLEFFNSLNDPILSKVDVVSYSITTARSYLNAHRLQKIGRINRIVILLTKEFEFLNKDTFNSMGFSQVTFKTLQHGEDDTVNKWIDDHKMGDISSIQDIVDFYNGSEISVRLDQSCQNATNRYFILRCDGKLYDAWESNKPIKCASNKGGKWQ